MCRSVWIGGWEGDLDGERCDMRAALSSITYVLSVVFSSVFPSGAVHVRFRLRSRFAIYRQVSSVHVLNFKGYAHRPQCVNQQSAPWTGTKGQWH